MSNIYPIEEHSFGVIVIGGGGAGLCACIEAAKSGLSVACVSKLFPLRSNTVAAQGGIAATLSNIHEDNWRWHFNDTIKSGAGIGDKSAVEILCRNAPSAVIELERMGVPFSRTESGHIYQRKFGGMRKYKNGEPSGPASRTCAVADRTGHAILHTLYQQCLKYDVKFFNEYFVLGMLGGLEEEPVQGCIAWSLNDGSLHRLLAPATILATGGYARIYEAATTSYACTGDGCAMATKIGIPIQDPEFVQFHPTALYPSWCLLSEAVRAEGGYLVNKLGNRFMQDYDPMLSDLSTRDVAARAIATEIQLGNGCGPQGNYVLLRTSHLPPDTFQNKLPGVRENALRFAGVDLLTDDAPVAPAAHYTMGGIPTNTNCEVLRKSSVVKGLMAVGETACVSVHGANRLGSNSLLDLIVFGKIAVSRINELANGIEATKNKPLQKSSPENSRSKLLQEQESFIIAQFDHRRYGGSCGAGVSTIRQGLNRIMQEKFGPFRNGKSMHTGLSEIRNLYKMCLEVDIVDRSLVWNTNLMESLELENMFISAIALANGAIVREESRGSHYREDFPQTDANFAKHTLVNINTSNGELNNISYREVDLKEPAP